MNIKNLIQIKTRSMKNIQKILIYYSRYATANSIKHLYLIINKINGYIEESNENKYLTLVSSEKSACTSKKYKEL